LRDYGVTDQTGLLKLTPPQFGTARSALERPLNPLTETVEGKRVNTSSFEGRAMQDKIAALDPAKKDIIASYTGQEKNQKITELYSPLMNEPTTGPPSNPFAAEFGTELPQGYAPGTPEITGNAWAQDPNNGNRWSWMPQEQVSAIQRANQANQAARTAELEAARGQYYQPSWMKDAADRAAAANKLRSQQVRKDPTRFAREEEARLQSLGQMKYQQPTSDKPMSANPLSDFEWISPSDTYVQKWTSPSGSNMVTEMKIGPGTDKEWFVVKDVKTKSVRVTSANKQSFDAARRATMEEERLNAAETLKDWLNQD
jgi:hypothetical protein